MNRRVSAALVRVAALCGLLGAPSVALAQLKCENDTDLQIRSVAFIGNATFDDEELASHVIVTPTDPTRRVIAGLTRRYIKVGTERCLRPGLLAADAQRLRSFYADQGFSRVVVDTASTVDGTWIDVRFLIREGVPVVVDSLVIRGLDSLDLGADLAGKLNSRKGQRYSIARSRADMDTIETRMRNAGHPMGVVLREVQYLDAERLHVAVVLDVMPGPLTRIGQISITRETIDSGRPAIDSTVIRDILRFREGDVYNERALFESERQFYRLGNFLSAEVTTDTSHVAVDSLIDVNVRVLEDLMRQIVIQPGWGTLDCMRARAEFTNKAFLGGLNKVELSGQVSKVGWAAAWPQVHDKLCKKFLEEDQISSSVVNYNATLRLTRPVTLRGGWLPSFSLYRERRGGYKAYLRTTQIGGAASVSKILPRSIQFQGTYNIEYGHTDAEEGVLCFFFRACDPVSRAQLTESDKRLAILGVTFSRDRRDNPDSTSRGTALRTDLRGSQWFFGSDDSLSFNKAVLDASWYKRPFGFGVIAVRLRGGIIGGGVATTRGRLPPPQERLYTGGETTVRGYAQNELGPLIYVTDDTLPWVTPKAAGVTGDALLQTLRLRKIPTGGNAMYVANFEYRLPGRLPGPILSKLQPILFTDVGKLWTRELDPAGQSVKWTPGVAIRYFSPIGPVQVNVGYNNYTLPAGPVYLDAGVTTGSLVCLSGGTSGDCLSANAIAPPNTFFKRLKFSIAFPPDF